MRTYKRAFPSERHYSYWLASDQNNRAAGKMKASARIVANMTIPQSAKLSLVRAFSLLAHPLRSPPTTYPRRVQLWTNVDVLTPSMATPIHPSICVSTHVACFSRWWRKSPSRIHLAVRRLTRTMSSIGTSGTTKQLQKLERNTISSLFRLATLLAMSYRTAASKMRVLRSSLATPALSRSNSNGRSGLMLMPNSWLPASPWWTAAAGHSPLS
ncbi:hypothetical protein K437DRAFT_256382 [Tilletiaria anomala UBC 951]|uniref:Uncharacterized protein n=1 Tax=Tilletiaria anomala (strain ATCC 24038 / CBS 436.72 / UBC 951) TaxID=1037660 RepID=A0A066W5B9_TILAU|nr:uncharacterized protein K437DRAFT_256382 [Tilletiaria anomala UBC 951]KDN45965.1 hypothetical protein K437DRAFT_256382 [Tilletiaria anomala UBC 951]